MVAELAGSSHLAREGSCYGMMGNKDIIKCKLPHRQHWSTRKGLHKRKRKCLHLLSWWLCNVVAGLYSLVPDFRMFLRATGWFCFYVAVYFSPSLFLETIPCVPLRSPNQKRERFSFEEQHPGLLGDKETGGRQDERWSRWKRGSEFMTLRSGWEGGGLRAVVATSWWVCSAAKHPSLRASANEIGAVITPTPFNVYDWSWHCLNYVYVPVPASVCSLDDAYFIRLPAAYMSHLRLVFLL